jgi:hypothetical protein
MENGLPMPPAATPTEKMTGSSSTLTEMGERFITWWIGELRAMVPSSLLARTPRRPPCSVEIFVDADGILTVRTGEHVGVFANAADTNLAEYLSTARLGRAPAVRLDVPHSACLVRKSVLPMRALRDARKLLELEMAENTPLSPDEVHSDWYVESEDPAARQLRVRHIILARTRLAAIRSVLEAQGLPMARLTVGHGEGRPLPVELLSGDEPGLRALLRSLSWRSRIMWIVGLGLLCAVPPLVLNRVEQKTALVEARRMEIMQQLRISPAADPVAIALASLPPLADVLNEIGARFPQSAALQSLDLVDNRLTVTLSKGDPAALVSAVQGSVILDVDNSAEAGRLVFTLKAQGDRP